MQEFLRLLRDKKHEIKRCERLSEAQEGQNKGEIIYGHVKGGLKALERRIEAL